MFEWLFDGYFGTADGFAGETADFADCESNDTIACSVYGKVTAYLGAFASTLGKTYLADDDLASADFFTTKKLNAQALARTVFYILGGTACFNV